MCKISCILCERFKNLEPCNENCNNFPSSKEGQDAHYKELELLRSSIAIGSKKQ